jgi:hypothetical protein
MMDIEIRPASVDEFEAAIGWAADEGWNPGLDDLAVFHQADPAGFLMGFRGGEPVSSISVVRYGKAFGFLGFYIVAGDHQGTGAGITTWNAGLAHLEGRTIGLDGVVAQQENYRKSGFVLAGRNIRFTGVPALGEDNNSVEIRAIKRSDLEHFFSYDREFFPESRDGFIADWAAPENDERRTGLLAISDGAIAGYSVIRECRSGYKIGPLFADNEVLANDLLLALCRRAPNHAEISIDVPEANAASIRMAERLGLKPVFETARMYKGPAPDLPISRIFGITTFELG